MHDMQGKTQKDDIFIYSCKNWQCTFVFSISREFANPLRTGSKRLHITPRRRSMHRESVTAPCISDLGPT